MEDENKKIDEVVDSLVSELVAAQEKHPGWPSDKIYMAAIMAEEVGG